MKSVVQQTGLSPHLIRVWEKRYGAVEPNRTVTNRRLYSPLEVERLRLLHAATQAGHAIGTIAHLSDDKLRILAGKNPAQPAPPKPNGKVQEPPRGDTHIEAALTAVRSLDAGGLELALRRASLALGTQGLLQKMIAPLVCAIGDRWQSGDLTTAHEHFASRVVQAYVARLARPYALDARAPGLLVATPAGQLHELGAVLVAAAASAHGWRVSHIGASLPAIEIAGGAVRCGARAVALSIVYPAGDPDLPAELETLRHCLPPGMPILVGGRAAISYRSVLDHIGATLVQHLGDLYQVLDAIQSRLQPEPRTRAA